MKGFKMRLELKGIEFTIPNKLIDACYDGKIKDPEIINAINTLITKSKVITRLKNPEKARAVKTTKTKEKIQNAINLLRLQGKPINPYQVAKLSGVAYNTARKYLKNNK
jgi:hypothetical protein